MHKGNELAGSNPAQSEWEGWPTSLQPMQSAAPSGVPQPILVPRAQGVQCSSASSLLVRGINRKEVAHGGAMAEIRLGCKQQLNHCP